MVAMIKGNEEVLARVLVKGNCVLIGEAEGPGADSGFGAASKAYIMDAMIGN